MEINSLTFSYKKMNKPVLSDLTIKFDPSKLNVIVGLNGAGKTTLLDLITRVLPCPSTRPCF